MKMKIKVLEMLGGVRCVQCKNTYLGILEINHINGGGRKESKNRRNIYSDIYYGRRNTDDLNVKCRLCNALDYLQRKCRENTQSRQRDLKLFGVPEMFDYLWSDSKRFKSAGNNFVLEPLK